MERLSDPQITTFFQIAATALEFEDRQLRERFSASLVAQRHRELHHGIFHVTEQPLVYVMFRALLTPACPVEVRWEHEYPNSGERMDLALLDTAGNVVGCIEAKWLDDRYKPSINKIDNDFEKMNRWYPPGTMVRKFVLALWHKDTREEVKKTIEKVESMFRFPVRFQHEWHHDFPTRLWGGSPKEKAVTGCVTLLEVLPQ